MTPKPPPTSDVVADDLPVLADGEEADVVGVDVDAVVAGQADGEFEFARQVRFAVDRLEGIVAGHGAAGEEVGRLGDGADIDAFAGFVVGEPDLVVGAGAGVELFHQFAGEGVHLFVHGIAVVGAGRAHDVAFYVATGGERGELHFVDAANGVLEVRFQHAVELQALPRGDAERGVADFVAEVELGQQLVAGDAAAGNGGADHEAVELGFGGAAVDAGFGAAFAVVLLVGAVVLEELDAVFADEVVAVDELLGDVAARIIAFYLGNFDRADFSGCPVFRRVRHVDLYQIAKHYPS